MNRVGVALSGGGHRATVWAFGVLLYLVDAGRNGSVASISSVSGGSIANGVVAHTVDYANTDPVGFRAAIGPALTHIAREGLFVWGRRTNRYVVTTLVALVVGVVLPFAWLILAAVFGAGTLPVVVHVAGGAGLLVLLVGAWLFSRRSAVVERALAQVHFGGAPGARLADVHRPVEHVFCATELQSGYHAYLSPEFVYSYRFGVGTPADMTLARAVQCSACLPFAFAPRLLRTDRHGFPAESDGTALPRHLVLSDGGVYDNMADQWLTGGVRRVGAGTPLPNPTPEVDQVVVVNAGGMARLRRLSWLALPFVGDLRVLMRVTDIMYAGTTSQWRRDLVRRDNLAARIGEGQRGAILQTTQTPYTAADAFAGGDGPRAERARAALSHLDKHDPYGREAWRLRAEADASVNTVLGRLGPRVTADLLEHAYFTAMYALHTLLDHPLVPPPPRAAFEALVSGASGAAHR